MFVLIEDRAEKQQAQEQLVEALTGRLRSVGIKNIGFPSGKLNEKVYTGGSGRLWAAFKSSDKERIPRWWNAFGIYDEARGSQNITVEINIPKHNNSSMIAGFFARSLTTGAIFLMHDGSIGGGTKGVGRDAFLSWSNSSIIWVNRQLGSPRAGIIIGQIDDPSIGNRIWNFVQTVDNFKKSVRRGEFDHEDVQQRTSIWSDFREESSGRRSGIRRGQIDYISYHGDVVNSLQKKVKERLHKGQIVANTPLIDLYVLDNGEMIEIYEVKTSCDRQSIYTAIGQIFVHSSGAARKVCKFLVLPLGDLQDNFESILDDLKITLVRYTIKKGLVIFH